MNQPARSLAVPADVELNNFAKIIAPAFPEPDRDALVDALELWHRVTDWLVVETRSPGRLGNLALHRLTARHGASPELERVELPTELIGMRPRMLDPRWVNTERVLEVGTELVSLDVNGQFLAASSMDLGTGRPTRVGKTTASEIMRRPCYGTLAADIEQTGILGTLKAGDVLAGPTLRYLADDLGSDVPLSDSWVWEDSRRWLDTFYRLWRNARAALLSQDELSARYALAAVKAVPNAFLGGWLRSEQHNHSASLRVDWAHHVIARARANALRSIGKAAAQPLGLVADSVYFLGREECTGMQIPERGSADFGKLGKWKVDKEVAVTDAIVQAHANGRPNKLRDAINAAAEREGTK